MIRIHFLVPSDKAPAPHMTGGVVDTRDPRVGVLGTGVPHVAACNPAIVLSPTDMGTGEWWAVACRACGATELYKKAKETIPHPKRADQTGDQQVESMEGCC